MPCPKCNGRLVWRDRSWTSVGEDPGHWSCIACGKVTYPNEGRDQKTMSEMKTCTNPKCPKPNPQPISEFNKNAARPSGLESHCRTCTAQAQRDRKARQEKKTVLSKKCRNPKCEKAFTPKRSDSNFCSPKCREDFYVSQRKDAGTNGDGQKKTTHTDSRSVRSPIKQPITESLLIDPDAVRAIKRSIGKELLSEFSRFLEERYG